MSYDHSVPSLGLFLKRIAIDYMRYGYYRWAMRGISPHSDLLAIDRKLIATYGVTQCRTSRMRIRKQGLAVVQYVRWKRTFIVLATEGVHEAFDRICSYDVRVSPLHYHAYSIGVKNNRIEVRIRSQVWNGAYKKQLAIALVPTESLEKSLNALPYYRFPGVVRQLLKLTSEINLRRQVAGLPKVSLTVEKRHYKMTNNQNVPRSKKINLSSKS